MFPKRSLCSSQEIIKSCVVRWLRNYLCSETGSVMGGNYSIGCNKNEMGRSFGQSGVMEVGED